MPIIRFALCCVLYLCAGSLAFAADTGPLIFGVLNQQSPAKTAQRWNPILRYLTEKTGIALQLKMGVTVEETDAMMGRGEFDFVYTNHNFQQEFDGVYQVIARWAGKPIHGVIAVLEESGLHNLKDLAGKRVAFPSRDAFVAYAVPMFALNAARVSVDPVMSGNQEGALAQLRAKQVEAAAVNSRFLEQYAAQYGLRYRNIYVSEGYAELPVIAHPRLPANKVAAVQRALLGMKTDPGAAALLASLGFAGFEPAAEGDYNNARLMYRRVQ